MKKEFARDFSKYPDSKIVDEWGEGGIRAIILSCKGSHFTAYLGIPKDHPLANKSYDDIPLQVHGGLTYAGDSSHILPAGYYFYGWDYAHAGDRTFFDNPSRIFMEGLGNNDHDWTLEEVKKETQSAIYDFKSFVKLAEDIKNS